MSSLIKQLAIKSDILLHPNRPTARAMNCSCGSEMEVVKFAHSIVEECIIAAQEAQADFWVISNIKSRFGIE